jgi:peroxiredoxin
MQRVDALQREHAESGLAVIAINVAQDRSTAAAFLDKLGVGFSSVLDPDSRITKQYGVQGLPITYFVDKEGRIAGKIIGEADEKLLNSQLSRILPAPQ